MQAGQHELAQDCCKTWNVSPGQHGISQVSQLPKAVSWVQEGCCTGLRVNATIHGCVACRVWVLPCL